MTRTCNVCGLKADVDVFVPSARYKFGYRPLCLDCKNYYQSKKRGSYYEKRKRNLENINPVKLLIENGYCKDEEEAKKYINSCRI